MKYLVIIAIIAVILFCVLYEKPEEKTSLEDWNDYSCMMAGKSYKECKHQ